MSSKKYYWFTTRNYGGGWGKFELMDQMKRTQSDVKDGWCCCGESSKDEKKRTVITDHSDTRHYRHDLLNSYELNKLKKKDFNFIAKNW